VSRWWVGLGLAASGCAVTPITGKIAAGDEAFVIAVGEGTDGATDLFAAPATAGKYYRLTFSRVVEDRPRLSPSGTVVGFFRRLPTATELVLLDLTSMAERRARLPGTASRIGWSEAGDTVFVAAAADTLMAALAAPEFSLTPVPPGLRGGAARAIGEWLGPSGFAVVGPCRHREGVCALVSDSVETLLGPVDLEPVRWGPEAVGYVRDGRIEVRPLGGGRPTHPNLAEAPRGLRQLTHHPGTRRVDPAPPADARVPR